MIIRHIIAAALILLPFLASGQPATSVSTLSDLAAFPGRSNEVVRVRGFYTRDDWGTPRDYVWNPTSTAATNAVCIQRWASGSPITTGRWVHQWDGDVLAFGADHRATLATGSDSTAAIQAAVDYAASNKIGRLHFPTGGYRVSNTITIPINFSGRISGAGWNGFQVSSTIIHQGNTNAPMFRWLDAGYSEVDSIFFNCQRNPDGSPISNTNAYVFDNIGFTRHVVFKNLQAAGFAGFTKFRADTNVVPNRTQGSAFNLTVDNINVAPWGHIGVMFLSSGNSGSTWKNIAFRNNGATTSDRYKAVSAVLFQSDNRNETWNLLNVEHADLSGPAIHFNGTKQHVGFYGVHIENCRFGRGGGDVAAIQFAESDLSFSDLYFSTPIAASNATRVAIFRNANVWQGNANVNNLRIIGARNENTNTTSLVRVTSNQGWPRLTVNGVYETPDDSGYLDFDEAADGWNAFNATTYELGSDGYTFNEEFLSLANWSIQTTNVYGDFNGSISLVSDPHGSGRQGILKVVSGITNFESVLLTLTNVTFDPAKQSVRLRTTFMLDKVPESEAQDSRLLIGFAEGFNGLADSGPTNRWGIGLIGAAATLGKSNDLVWSQTLDDGLVFTGTIVEDMATNKWYTIDLGFTKASTVAAPLYVEASKKIVGGSRRAVTLGITNNFPLGRTLYPVIHLINRTTNAVSDPTTVWIDSFKLWMSGAEGFVP